MQPQVPQVGVTRIKDEFLSALPSPGVQQVARQDFAQYPPDTAIGATISINSLLVPDGMVMALTDVTFFAIAALPHLGGGAVRIPAATLAGLVRFSLLFGNRTPMQLDGTFLSPLAGSTRDLGERSGWPFTERVFGVQRETAFAIYARGGQQIDVQAIVDVLPDFPLTALGAEMAGFTVPQSLFSQVFSGV
jgi:hypothetical protein